MSIHISGGAADIIITDDIVRKTYTLQDEGIFNWGHKCITTELVILNLLDGTKGFPQIIDIEEDSPNYIIVMKNLGQPIENVEYSQDMFKKILRNVAILHAHNIVHNDIKPPNILIDENENISLIDFSHSSIMAFHDDTQSHPSLNNNGSIGTHPYMPPEVLTPVSGWNSTCATDIWSLGCILYELITRDVLFDSACYAKVEIIASHKKSGKCLDKIDSIIGHELEKEMILRMIQHNPSKRPTAIQLLQMMGENYTVEKIYNVNKKYEGCYHKQLRCFDMTTGLYNYVDNLMKYVIREKVNKDRYELCYLFHIIIGLTFYENDSSEGGKIMPHDVLTTSDEYMGLLIFVIKNIKLKEMYSKIILD